MQRILATKPTSQGEHGACFSFFLHCNLEKQWWAQRLPSVVSNSGPAVCHFYPPCQGGTPLGCGLNLASQAVFLKPHPPDWSSCFCNLIPAESRNELCALADLIPDWSLCSPTLTAQLWQVGDLIHLQKLALKVEEIKIWAKKISHPAFCLLSAQNDAIPPFSNVCVTPSQEQLISTALCIKLVIGWLSVSSFECCFNTHFPTSLAEI